MKWLLGLYFRVLSWLVAALPVRWRERIGDFIGFVWFDVLRLRRKIAIENVGVAFPEKSLREQTAIARSSLRHLGRTLVEYTLFPFFQKDDFDRHFSVTGNEHVEAALARGHGAIFLTLHLGSGDFAIAGLSRIGYRTHLISKEFKARWLNEMWFGMRARHGTKFISPEKSSFDILRALRRNEIVIFVLDQWMGPPVGVRTLFFGKQTGTAMGLAIIASRTKAPVIPCYTWREGNGRHAIVFEKPIESKEFADSSEREQNIAVMTQIYTDKIEEIIRRHPEQWMWIHRRWKVFRD
jgi:KDO2-lipid IV(A) lauroyltransferase